MVFSIVIGVLIFGYAGFALYRSLKKSKEGKCAACSIAKTCPSANCESK